MPRPTKAPSAASAEAQATQDALDTARREAKLDRRRLEAVTEAIPMAVVLIEAATGKFSYMNCRARDLYGVDYTGVDLEGHVDKVHALRLDGSPYPLEQMPVARSLRSSEVVRDEEMIIERPDGSRLPVVVSSAPILDAGGAVNAVVVVFEDISGRKAAERALLAANAALVQNDRAKNEFIAILSHELRNPLAPIRYAVPILQGEQLSEGARRALGVIERQLDHLARLAEDLLDLGRITTNSAPCAAPALNASIVPPCVRVPVAPELSSGDQDAAPATVAGTRLKVLVVDDNADLVEMLVMLVESMGHDVRRAFDGPTAVSAALSYRPDVVLLDLGLPGVSGLDVARAFREEPQLAHVFLVALTGWGQADDRRRTQAAGFDAHLTKPADPDTLVRLLNEVGARS